MMNEYSSKCLIGDQRYEQTNTLQKRAVNMGFEHLLGRSKYSPYLMNKTKKRLLELFSSFPKFFSKLFIKSCLAF